MARKYSKKTSEKVERTMREFKRGTLKSGSGGKVTSRKQAIAIGLSQARAKGYKVPRAHATMDIDAQVRAYLSNMRPDAEVDAYGVARALKVDPLGADYALQRAQKAGLAVSSDGRWFSPRSRSSSVAHSRVKKKTSAQLDREIASALAKKPADQWTVHDRLAVMTPTAKKRELKDLQQAKENYFRALGYAGNTPDQVRKYHEAIAEIDAKIKLFSGSTHATRRRSHSTKAMSNGLFAIEIDRAVFDNDRVLPVGARWRADRVKLAEDELARGRSYRRPKDARYAVIEWTGYRGEVGRLLDWLEGASGVTRYAEIFE